MLSIQKVKNNFLSVLKRLAFAYVVVCLFMWAAQRHLLYMPQNNIRPPVTYGLNNFEDIRLKSKDGTNLQAWYHKAESGYPTIVYFHGNGDHIGGRAHYFKLLSDAGFGVLALSYRGYGKSEGSPSEEGFYSDARAIIEYASAKLMLTPHDIIIYGESIGTGVAVQMATEFPFAALILQSPYTSIDALAKDNYPWLPVNLLLEDHFDSLSKISNVHIPILLFHGEKDNIVPIRFGKELFEKANPIKKSIYFPENGHVDFDLSSLTQAVIEFCKTQNVILAK